MIRWSSILILSVLFVSSCQATVRTERQGAYQRDTAERRTEILDRLMPDGRIPADSKRRRALVDATAAVIKNVDKDDLRESVSKTQRVLNGASLDDLERIDALFPKMLQKYRDRE